jgi:hypothetical protein
MFYPAHRNDTEQLRARSIWSQKTKLLGNRAMLLIPLFTHHILQGSYQLRPDSVKDVN